VNDPAYNFRASTERVPAFDIDVDDEPSARVFGRSISVPPGFPWDQAKAARLEARVSSPLPAHEVALQMRRLDAWAPGRPARYAAFYARRADVRAGLSELVEIDGVPLEVLFASPETAARRRTTVIAIAASVAAFVSVLVVSVGAAMTARCDAEEQVSRLELSIDQRTHALAVRSKSLNEARALDNSGLADRDIDHVLNDLAWVGANKGADVRFLSWYWDRGVMAVEVRGSAPPFSASDREIRRAEKPTQRGVWLYGIASAKASNASGAGPALLDGTRAQ